VRRDLTAEAPFPADWLGEVEASFAAAADGPPSERRLRLAGRPVRLVGAEAVLYERLTTAFAHLADDAGDVELTINLWDSRMSGAPPPPVPERRPSEPRGTVYYYDDGRIRSAYQPQLGILSVLDAAAATAWFWCESADDLPFWERAAPFRQILHWWLSPGGTQLLHGGAVGFESGGILLVGPSGSGKSTTALACLESNLLYAADDYVAVGGNGKPYVHSCYSSAKVAPGNVHRLPHLAAVASEADLDRESDKLVFYLGSLYPERTCAGFPLRAVVVPKVASTSRITPLAAGAALRALAPSTLLQLHPAGAEALAGIVQLLHRVPTFLFEVGPEVAELPAMLERFLEEL
jgi:hypothetical protein